MKELGVNSLCEWKATNPQSTHNRNNWYTHFALVIGMVSGTNNGNILTVVILSLLIKFSNYIVIFFFFSETWNVFIIF